MVGEPLPRLSLHHWEERLRSTLERARAPDVRFRVIRVEGDRAIVAVAHVDLARARRAWNTTLDEAARSRINTRRTWGTLVDAKAWIVRKPLARGRGPGSAVS
ncbi:MAG TPA: hypothetical protein VGS18_00305 [Thermoplasmata archaeon]|nr:hypothetical protein [Thermoplasmata archaeon]